MSAATLDAGTPADEGLLALYTELQRSTGTLAAVAHELSPRIRAELDRKRELLAKVRTLVDELERDVGWLERLLGDLDPDTRDVAGDGLRGKAIAAVAIEVIRLTGDPGAAIHYRTWYALVERAGHVVGGKDPLGTFLTVLAGDRRFEHVGTNRSDLYRLRQEEESL